MIDQVSDLAAGEGVVTAVVCDTGSYLVRLEADGKLEGACGPCGPCGLLTRSGCEPAYRRCAWPAPAGD